MIGLGQAGCNIAKLFKPHAKNYKIILLDADNGLDEKATVEEYDEIDFKFKQKGLKSHDEASLFVCGSGKIAGATLRVLEAIGTFKITVYYIVPDLEFCSREEKLRHKVHFGVLQEYARSGVINELVILDNKQLIDLIGAGTTLKYYEKVNYFIYSTIQNLMYCKHVDPDFGKIHKRKDISRISTIGLGNFDEEEKLMFALDNITETCYIINIEEEDLDNDSQVIPNCQGLVRENKEKGRDTSFAIWRSSEESSFYSLHYTHYIQETIK
tara:strand:+ start:694 stop:1500 length:807 start_codon:yes stop_codon:yes gene_type:complete